MRLLILVPVMVVCQVALSFAQNARQVAGKVTDSTGAPVAGVRVVDSTLEEVATGSDGRYAMVSTFELVRFLKSGYRPVTKVLQSPERSESSAMLDVVLEATSETPWAPPVCARKSRGKRLGDWMRFTVPKGIRVHGGQDIDYQTGSVTVRGAWMQHAFGIMWSYGFPVSRTLAEMVSVEERQVTVPEGWVFDLIDYRGVRADGSRWRTLATYGETITYDHADAQAAAAFDQILASLCFAR